jgi:hypothetical protein
MAAFDDLVKGTNDPDRWRAFVPEIAAVLQAVDTEAARRMSSAALAEKDAEAERVKAMAEPKRALSQMAAQNWPAVRMQYTLGQLDTEKLILCCERKLLDWQSVFNAKAAFGAAEDMPAIFDAARQQGVTLDLAAPLRAAAKPMLLVAGLRHEGNLETVQELLKLGADPGIDSGAVYQAAVVEGRTDIGRALAKHGQGGLLDTAAWMRWGLSQRKPKLYADFRAIYWDYGRFQALDTQTLAETKPLPDNAGNLRILYNFAARRVEEIHEFANPKQNTVTGFTFDEYGSTAIEAAHAKLAELGGDPADAGPALRGKSTVPKPGVFGLNGSKQQ